MKTPETRLEKRVAKWLKSGGENYDDGPQGAYDDLMQGGCQSGMVGSMIYYTDTVKFYKLYREEIDSMLVELLDDIGSSVNDLFGDKWDKDDPFCRNIYNQNLLAWFGFEETARRLMEYENE